MARVLAWIALVAVPAQRVETYRVQHRPAAELVKLARGVLGADGDVMLDARTATLVLNGSHDSVQRALRLLERLDTPLRQIVVTSDVHELDDLEAWAARVRWQVSLGPARIGTISRRDGVAFGARGERARNERRSRSTLRMTEGSPGIIRSGDALPVLFEPYWGTTAFARVDTGFEVEARLLEDDRVHLELRPFAGRVAENGTLRYIAASTAVTVRPGEIVVVAESSGSSRSREVDPSRVATRDVSRQQVIVVSVEVEN